MIGMDEGPTRRLVIAAALGVGGMLAAGSRAPLRPGTFDWTSPEDNLRALVKISGDLAPRKPFAGWYGGHVFALFEGRMPQPLFGLNGFGLGWMERQPSGIYHHAWKEVGYYTDLRTGDILDRWRNPFLDEEVEPLHIQNRRANQIVASSFDEAIKVPPDGSIKVAHGNYPRLGDAGSPLALQWLQCGDMTSVWSDIMAELPNRLQPEQWPRESSGERIALAEWFSFNVRTRDLENPRLTNAPSNGAWVRIGAWLPWMLMGQRPGRLCYKATTRKCMKLEELPE